MNSNDFQKWIAAWKPDEHLSEVRVLKREEMRMLYVIAEHRAWVKQLSMYVNARQTDLPILDLNACEFGKWLQHQENSEFCALTHQMKDVHREIHEKAAEMIAKLHVKSTEHTLQTMREIDALKDTLVELLSASMDK
jgi:hypothetical protein